MNFKGIWGQTWGSNPMIYRNERQTLYSFGQPVWLMVTMMMLMIMTGEELEALDGFRMSVYIFNGITRQS